MMSRLARGPISQTTAVKQYCVKLDQQGPVSIKFTSPQIIQNLVAYTRILQSTDP